jgi:hypothetical protein
MVTEIEALAAICVAVDRATADDPARRADVGRVLGLEGAAARAWSRADRRHAAGDALAGLPEVDDALAALAQVSPGGDMALSRALAIGALAHADPAYGPRGASGQRAAGLLVGGDLAPDGLGLDLLNGLEQEDSYTGVIRYLATNTGLLRVLVGPGNVDPVASFVTPPALVFGATLDKVKLVLNPENWPRCYRSHWSAMSPREPSGVQKHYRETVSLGHGLEAFTVEACLLFVQSQGPDDVAVLDYKLCSVDEHHEGSGVVVDEGWIVAAPTTDGVRVTTSKRVQFADMTVEGPSLVLTGCGLGYGDLARGLIDACLRCKQAVLSWYPMEVE